MCERPSSFTALPAAPLLAGACCRVCGAVCCAAAAVPALLVVHVSWVVCLHVAMPRCSDVSAAEHQQQQTANRTHARAPLDGMLDGDAAASPARQGFYKEHMRSVDGRAEARDEVSLKKIGV